MCDTCSKLFLINDHLVCCERLPAGHNPFQILLCPEERIKTHRDFSFSCGPCALSALWMKRRKGHAWTRGTQMCSQLQVPELKGHWLGLRPCLSLTGSHIEALWSNHKPEDLSPEYSSWNSPCYCPARQSISIHGRTQREMIGSHLLTPI